jgi:hypothetical protein
MNDNTVRCEIYGTIFICSGSAIQVLEVFVVLRRTNSCEESIEIWE